jgi:hypothetical protein
MRTIRKQKKVRGLCAALGVAALGMASSQGATWYWAGANSNSAAEWETTTNWNPAGVPGGVADILLVGNRSGNANVSGIANASAGSVSVIRMNASRTVGSIYAAQANDRNFSIHPGTGGSLTFDNGLGTSNYIVRRDASSNAAVDLAQLRAGIDVNMVLNSNLVFDVFVKRGYGTSTPTAGSTMSNFINSNISGNGSLTVRAALLTTTGNATTNAFYSIEGGSGANTHAGGTIFQKLNPVLGNSSTVTTDVQSVYRLNKQHATGDGATTVGAGAIVMVTSLAATGGAINDTTDLNLLFDGVRRGQMAIATGHNETVARLFLDGVAQAAGTYGATGSGATFILDDWFTPAINAVTGTHLGTLTVLGIPEPGAIALSMLGGLLLFARRRR